MGFPLLGVYSATKAGVVRMTEAMALERAIRACAPTRSARVHRHRVLERSGAQFAALAGVSFDEVATVGQGRLSKSEDVAALATFLASDGASFINGTAILVDGGMNLRRV